MHAKIIWDVWNDPETPLAFSEKFRKFVMKREEDCLFN
jgi:hypothetical protein